MTLPAPTALTPTLRYIPAGTRRIVWVPTIADITAPTSAELTAGTDLTAEVAEITGFSTESGTVEVPDYGSRQVGKIAGLVTQADSTIKTYLSTDATDARSLLTRDLAGNVVIFPEGLTASGKMSVYAGKITSAAVDEVAPGDPATMTNGFAVLRSAENIAIPST